MRALIQCYESEMEWTVLNREISSKMQRFIFLTAIFLHSNVRFDDFFLSMNLLPF